MNDFHERLKARKQQLKAEKVSTEIPISPPPSFTLPSVEVTSTVNEFKSKVLTFVMGASIFMGVLGFFIAKDWWQFIGSPEYSQWKTRTEGEK